MDQNAKQQIIDRLKDASNVLVTVSANPSVDQLAACIGMTLFLNKIGKHGTAVFSGKIPSTIEFLKPDQTIETDTNSLRDFIIALDKSKADKLRYKVEDKIVKIFITPYRTSLSDKDLEFSQGDFNVDVVIGLGVREREDLDQAIMAHGRILHDATVISVNNHDQGNLGTINWVDLNASSLSEMLVELAAGLGADKVDGQMATAFLTGIVAETNRFSNDKTSAQTMTIASELMSAGANQQLIASQLEAAGGTKLPAAKKPTTDDKTVAKDDKSDDGSLQITHDDTKAAPDADVDTDDKPLELPKAVDTESKSEPKHPAIVPLGLGSSPSSPASDLELPPTPNTSPAPKTDFPKLGKAEDRTPTQTEDATRLNDIALNVPAKNDQLTANTQPEHLQVEPSTDPFSMPNNGQNPILTRSTPFGSPNDSKPGSSTMPPAITPFAPPATPFVPPAFNPLTPPVAETPATENIAHVGGETVEEAREAVNAAIRSDGDQRLEPLQGLGAQPVNLGIGAHDTSNPSSQPSTNASQSSFTMPQPPLGQGINPSSGLPGSGMDTLVPPATPTDTTASNIGSPTPPPPVPPPLMPPPSSSSPL